MSARPQRRTSDFERKTGKKLNPGHFLMMPSGIFGSAEYALLSPRAVKLLVDIGLQYNGHNNGDLCATWALMKPKGWQSKSQLAKALSELESSGWIIKTLQGSINAPTLWAITWRQIDAAKRRYDSHVKVGAPPLSLWREMAFKYQRPKSKRRVTKSPARTEGQPAPHQGVKVAYLAGRLPRAEG